jgi:integrase
MNITKRTTRNGVSYRVRIRVQGYPPVSRTFPTKSEAKTWGQQHEADLLSGKLGLSQAHYKTLKDAIERFLGDPPSGYGDWIQRPNNRSFLPWWLEHFGHYKLCELRPTTIVQGRDLLLKTPSLAKTPGGLRRKRSAATVNRYVSALSAVLQVCLELWGWIAENPCRGVKKLPEKNGRCRILSPEEQRRLLLECESDPNLKDVVLLALLTAGRRGEICELRWRDVNFKAGQLTFWETKNGTHRSIPLCQPAQLLLRRRLSEHRLSKEGWVFPAERSAGPIDVSHRFKRFALRAGIEDFRFHDLRHCAASALARAGVPERQIQEILGHKTLQMVQRYTHLRPSELKTAIEYLATDLKETG